MNYVQSFSAFFRPEDKNLGMRQLFWFPQIKTKLEKMDEAEKEGEETKHASEEQNVEIKKEAEVTTSEARDDTAAPAKPDPAMGRLVMTIEGHQKQLSFTSNDLLSTATMLHGDKVRP